jgi:RND family efflux transporter MFP subunit
VSPGDTAVVHVPEMPDRGFPGKVTRLADALDPATRTLLTEIDVPNPDGALTAGTYCTVDLNVPRKSPSLVIPADAVVFDGDGLHVVVVENGTARFKHIAVVRDLGTQVEVRDGVKPGDQVIRNPAVDLLDGSKVQVSAELPGANS